MILQILLALVIGVMAALSGLVPSGLSDNLDFLLTAILCLLLFVIGIDLSQNRGVVGEVKRLGWKILLLPLFIAMGSILGALAVSFIVGMSPQNAMAIGAGFGWYSLSAVILTGLVGAEIGTMALLTNVFREILSIMLLPLVVKYFGKTAAVAPGGATTMDTTLPFVVKYAGSEMGVVALISGIILSLLVVFLVPALAGL